MKCSFAGKIIALLLSVLMLAGLPVTICAGSVQTADYPIVYLPDMTDVILYQNPNLLNSKEVFNVNSTDFLKNATSIVTGLMTASEDAEKGASQVNNAVTSMLSGIACDVHGNSKNTTLGAWQYTAPVSYNENTPIYTENIKALVAAADGQLDADRIFVFNYDWRLDPTQTAVTLRDYIDKVLVTSHSDKVRLISGGYGGIIVNCYLYKYETHAKNYVSSCVFLDSMIMGTSIIGDIMSGHLVRTVKDALKEAESIFDLGNAYDVITGADVGTAFARYLKQDPGGLLSGIFGNFLGSSNYSELFTWFATTLMFDIIQDEGMLDKVGKGYKEMLVLADNGIYDGGLAEYLRNMPGIWAMVPEERYEDAVTFMFGSKKDVDEELLQKIENYRTVLGSTERTLKRTQLNGVNTDIVAGYDMQVLPLTASTNEQSDGFVATRYAGVGATTGDMDKDLTRDNQCRYGNHDHMEPGRAVDASTCFLPENTWFIKKHNHMDYASATAADFVFWLSYNTTQRNVYQNAAYPQYMQKAVLGDKVYAYSTPSDSEMNNYTYGDLDVDGKISAADARLALRYSVGLEGSPSQVMTLIGDVDGNGRIDSADARLILRYSVGLDRSFAAAAK